jgi:hypothetical protein
MGSTEPKISETSPWDLKSAKTLLEATKNHTQRANDIAKADFKPGAHLEHPLAIFQRHDDMRDMNNALIIALEHLVLTDKTFHGVAKLFSNLETDLGQLKAQNEDLTKELARLRQEKQVVVDLSDERNAKIKKLAEEQEE